MIEFLSEGTRKVRKRQQCFHCCRPIWPGETALYHTLKYDHVYTLYMHEDCEELFRAYERDADLNVWDWDEGYPPTIEQWRDSGVFDGLCNAYRGQFPHAVCRLEFATQLREGATND